MPAKEDAKFEKGDYDGVIADYDRFIALNPKIAAAYFIRASAYEAKGDVDKAITDYRKALEIDPLNDVTKKSLERLDAAP